mmetsp:Transcript_102562/g.328618  ORF Transcript_102562/g.328618 Transcript_102562/m.328618 type:complete len:155 (+) Transcript_102562:292-756(+)
MLGTHEMTWSHPALARRTTEKAAACSRNGCTLEKLLGVVALDGRFFRKAGLRFLFQFPRGDGLVCHQIVVAQVRCRRSCWDSAPEYRQIDAVDADQQRRHIEGCVTDTHFDGLSEFSLFDPPPGLSGSGSVGFGHGRHMLDPQCACMCRSVILF